MNSLLRLLFIRYKGHDYYYVLRNSLFIFVFVEKNIIFWFLYKKK